MELIAVPSEIISLMDSATQTLLTFMDTREHINRFFVGQNLPALWAQTGPSYHLHANARMGEYFVFQIGLYAVRKDAMNITVNFSDLVPVGMHAPVVSSSFFTCFNFGGVDYHGKRFVRQYHVPKNNTASLWCGVDLPQQVLPEGIYIANITLNYDAGHVQLQLFLTLHGTIVLPFQGLDDIYKLGRMKWLDSSRGIDSNLVSPFVPVTMSSTMPFVVTSLNKQVQLDKLTGLPAKMTVYDRRKRVSGWVERKYYPLDQSMQLLVFPSGSNKPLTFNNKHWFTNCTSAQAQWTAQATASDGLAAIELTVDGTWDFDSYGEITMNISNSGVHNLSLSDIQLSLPISSSNGMFSVGMGKAGSVHTERNWRWKKTMGDNALWIGRVEAGMFLKLKGSGNNWNDPMYSHDYPTIPFIPPTWGGINQTDGATGCNITSHKILCFSGSRILRPGEFTTFLFDFAVTPSKPVNMTAHWQQRYYQVGYGTSYLTPQQVVEKGATVVTLHQGIPGIINGTLVNPYINYPFVPYTVELMQNYSQQAKELGMSTKFYYTIRELSNHVAELFPLLTLRGEVIIDTDPYNIPQPGYCHDWDCHGGEAFLQEHIITNYSACWQQVLSNGEWDAAMCDIGTSRWFNYYVEGAYWSVSQPPYIGGIYYDGINFDRLSMRRLRKVINEAAQSVSAAIPLLDVHTGHAKARPPAIGYLSHFPYVDSVWNGEGFNWGGTWAYYLIEISSLLHGLSGDRLGGKGLDHRGMLFGMTQRNSKQATALWSVWDKYHISDSTMIGFWEDDAPATLHHTNSSCTEGFTMLHNSYKEACGGSSSNRGFGGGCGSGTSPFYPKLTIKEAKTICCNMTEECKGFSFSHAMDSKQRGVGCFKLNDNCGITKNNKYDGYSMQCSIDDFKATTFVVFQSHALIVIASWCPNSSTVSLQLNATALGLQKPLHMYAPAIPGIQSKKDFGNGTLPFLVEKGWILVVEPNNI